MNKRNVIIVIISVLILTCLFAFARTTTTDLGLVKPTWTEALDILTDLNANSDIVEAFANDPLEFDSDLERLEDRAGAMWTGNTETGLTITYQDSDNTIDAVIGADDIVETMLKAVNLPADEDIFTYESTTGDFQWHTLAELSIQPLDAGLTSIAGLTTAASTLIYTTALDTYAVLGANATATNKWLRQVSSGAPSWEVIADGDVPNDITINLATLATTFTCTDNESEDLACTLVFVDGATGAQGAETDGDLAYNPSTGTLSATIFSAGSYLTGEVRLVTSDADPDTTGEIKHDSTITGIMAGGALRWFDNDSSRMVVDLEADPSNDDYVVAYDAAADGFYMKADADSGGATAWDNITNPDANDEIDFGAYVIELNVADFRVGDGGANYVKFADNGVVTFEGTASITITDLLAELDAGAHSIGFTQQSTTGDGTTTINWTLGNKFKFTFGAQNDTFTFTAPTNPCNILLMLIQDGTGSRLATWPGTVKWAAGTAPTLTTGASTIDICSFYWDGTNYFGVASLAFAVP